MNVNAMHMEANNLKCTRRCRFSCTSHWHCPDHTETFNGLDRSYKTSSISLRSFQCHLKCHMCRQADFNRSPAWCKCAHWR